MKNEKTEKTIEDDARHKETKLPKDKLHKKFQQCKDENKQLLEKLQRISADYANYQKRLPKQIETTVAYEKEKLIKSLFPILDNFEHILQNAQTVKSATDILKGVQIVYDQMLNIPKSHGVDQIKALGENFDPALHQAMLQKTESEQPDNIILEEFQKGYKLNDRVLRPSRVVVNKILPPENETAPQK